MNIENLIEQECLQDSLLPISHNLVSTVGEAMVQVCQLMLASFCIQPEFMFSASTLIVNKLLLMFIYDMYLLIL